MASSGPRAAFKHWPAPSLTIRATRTQARNGLENYAYSMRNTIKDGTVADKLTAEDKEAIDKAVDKTIDWLDHNQARAQEGRGGGGGQAQGGGCVGGSTGQTGEQQGGQRVAQGLVGSGRHSSSSSCCCSGTSHKPK